MDVSREEYESRLERIRHAMGTHGLDALLIYSWKRGQVRYVSGYGPNYIANVAVVVVPLRGEPSLFIRFPFDLERAHRLCWFEDVAAGGTVADVGKAATKRLRAAGLQGGRIGLVGGDAVMDEMPYTLYEQLRADLPTAAFSDARSLLMNMRRTKSPAECALLVESARVADAAAGAAAMALKPGVSEFDVVAAAEATARAAGAEYSLVTIASQGAHDLIGPPEDKTIAPQDMVILEAAVAIGGYWTQVARVLMAGKPTAKQQDIYRAVQRAYRAASAAACPGACLGEVVGRARDTLGTAGYAEYVENDMGHGIGLDLPDPPSLDADVQELIEEGMAMVIHPSIRVPGVGGAFVGGTVLVSAHGPHPIHSIPEELT